MAGLHGLEIAVGRTALAARGRGRGASGAADALTRRLAAGLADVKECRIEAKGSSVAVHVRAVPRGLRADVLARADGLADPWIRERRAASPGRRRRARVPASRRVDQGRRRAVDRPRRRAADRPTALGRLLRRRPDRRRRVPRRRRLSVVVGRRASGARYRLECPGRGRDGTRRPGRLHGGGGRTGDRRRSVDERRRTARRHAPGRGRQPRAVHPPQGRAHARAGRPAGRPQAADTAALDAAGQRPGHRARPGDARLRRHLGRARQRLGRPRRPSDARGRVGVPPDDPPTRCGGSG